MPEPKDYIAKDVSHVIKGNGFTVLFCREADFIDMDKLWPIEGFTRNDIYQYTMREYIEWIEKATKLIFDLYGQLQNAYDPKEIPEFAERVGEFCPYGG